MIMQIEPQLFRDAVHEWYDPLYRFAFTLCRSPEDAADLTQNAFHKLAGKGGSILDPAKIKSWLFSVVHREFIDQYRRQRRYPQSTLESLPESAASVDGVSVADKMDARLVLEALERMDDKYRMPLTLFYLRSFSYKDIAETLDLPIGTVMSRLRRGKDQLRAEMENVQSRKDTTPIPFSQKEANHG